MDCETYIPESFPVVNELPKVFPDYLTGISTIREIDFG